MRGLGSGNLREIENSFSGEQTPRTVHFRKRLLIGVSSTASSHWRLFYIAFSSASLQWPQRRLQNGLSEWQTSAFCRGSIGGEQIELCLRSKFVSNKNLNKNQVYWPSDAFIHFLMMLEASHDWRLSSRKFIQFAIHFFFTHPRSSS